MTETKDNSSMGSSTEENGTVQRPFDNSYWVIPGKLLAGEYPGDRDSLRARLKVGEMLNAGFTYFIDLTEVAELKAYDHIVAEEANVRGIEATHRRRAIIDEQVPSQAFMVEILNEIDTALDNGHRVYVHCWGGVGRTGTVIGCYLARKCGSGELALKQLDSLWRAMSIDKVRRHFCSPHTGEQRKMVKVWSEAG
jgi:hypothetical protein